ncbi:hypothetical protein [Faecalibaculum rodentium]
MTQEHVSELPDVTRQYVSGLERGVTALLLQHSSTCAKPWIPAPTTFCWTNGQVPTRCSMPGSISSRMSKRRRSWTPSKTSHSLRNCPGSKKNLRPEDGGRLFYAVFAILKLYCQN